MNVEITETRDNRLFARKEVEAEVRFDAATPKRAEIKETLCGKLGVNPELAVIRKIGTKFGQKKAHVLLHVYDDKAKLGKLEQHYVMVREGFAQKKEKKKKASAAKAAKK
jgi:ribosomal protein S24E